MIEIWKPLVHNEIADGFMLSTYGRIKTKDTEPHEATYHSTNGYEFAPFLLKPTDTNGPIIPKIRLFPIDDLLAMTFVQPSKELVGKRVKVVHVDGDNKNNHVDNLIWEEDVEEWKELTYPNVRPGYYWISNHGHLKTAKQAVNPFLSHGYRIFGMMKIDNKESHIFLHRAVAHEFIGPNINKLDVNHIDGNKDNNHVKNLEYVTRSMNIIHAIETGLNPQKGELNPGHVLTEEDVRLICKLFLKTNGSIQETLDELHKMSDDYAKINRHHLEQIKYKNCWVDITNEYFDKNTFGKCIYGETSIQSKITNDEATMICELLLKYKGSTYEVVKYMHSIGKGYVNRSIVNGIKFKRTWKWLSDKYFNKDTFAK